MATEENAPGAANESPAAALSRYLAQDRTIDLAGTTRSEVFSELSQKLARELKNVSARRIVAALEAREKTLSTRVSDDVAIPHAVLPLDQTRIALGRSREGIVWDEDGGARVRIVALIAGPRSEHLNALAVIAGRLSREGLVEALLAARNAEQFHALLVSPPSTEKPGDPEKKRISQACFEKALMLAQTVRADAVLLHADVARHLDLIPFRHDALRLLLVTSDPSQVPDPLRREGKIIHLPFTGHDRGGRVDVALLYAVSQGAIEPTERVVSVCGVPGSEILDTVRVTDLAWEYRDFLALRETILPKDLEQHVLLRTLQVAANIAEEGREGDAVGTLFVVGDHRRVQRRCRQMIINPFHGCGDNGRNILDPGLEETIKEFARLDGAFIVRGDGRIHSAGTFLRTEATVDDLPKGLGARHATAAAITLDTQALSVVVSQSTRRVRLFKSGRPILTFQP